MRKLIPIVLIPVLLATYVVAASFLVETQVFEVTVGEAIMVGEQTTTEFTFYPGETRVVEVTITNLSSNPLPVEIEGSVEPTEGIEVTDPGLVEVPADGEPHTYEVAVTADTDIEVGVYELTIEVRRE